MDLRVLVSLKTYIKLFIKASLHCQNQEAKIHVTLPLPRGRTRFCFSNRYVAFEKNPRSVKRSLVGLFPSQRSPPPPFSPLSLPQVPVLTVTSVLPGHAPRGLIAARHLLTEINFSFRCLSFGFLSAKKPQDVVVSYPCK